MTIKPKDDGEHADDPNDPAFDREMAKYEPQKSAAIQDEELAAQLAAPAAKGWTPEPGDQVGGILVDRFTADVGGYGEYPVLEILQGDGTAIACHCFHEVLKGQVLRKDPQVGDKVGIRYFGKEEGAGNYEGYENYKLVVIPKPHAVEPTA